MALSRLFSLPEISAGRDTVFKKLKLANQFELRFRMPRYFENIHRFFRSVDKRNIGRKKAQLQLG